MDAFETRIRFVDLIKRLTSSQSSIQKLVAYALKNASKCGDDLWQCLMEECERATLNARINIFYALDSLMEASSSASAADAGVYVPLVQRDLNKLVTLVVPPTKEGILNSLSAQQILKSWKTRRVIDPSRVEAAEALLIAQKSQSQQQHQNGHAPAAPGKSSAATKFSRNDILRRIEDDRERHKRLRERAWVLPVPSTIAGLERIARPALLNILGPSAGLNLGPSQPSPFSPTSPASVSQASRQHGRPQAHQRGSQQSEQQQQQQQGANAAELDPIDVEFEQLWEKEMLQSDGQGITPEELEAMRAESQRAFGP